MLHIITYLLLFVSLFVGDPFRCHYWLLQCLVYLLVMFVEKLLIGPLVLFSFWKEVSCLSFKLVPSSSLSLSLSLSLGVCVQVGKILPRNEKLRIAIVIFIVPFVVNVSYHQLIISMCTHTDTHTHTHTHTRIGHHVLDSGQYFNAKEKEQVGQYIKCPLSP